MNGRLAGLMSALAWGAAGELVVASPAQDSAALHPSGLMQRLTSLVEDSSAEDWRRVRLPDFHLDEGQAASALLPPGPFVAVWEGRLRVPFLDDYEFHLEGRGRVRLEIDGQLRVDGELSSEQSLDTPEMEMDRGQHAVRIRYQSPLEGEASLRLRWSSFDFHRQTPSPQQWSALEEAAHPLRRARQLFSSRRCAHCHRGGDVNANGAMPELAYRAPSLRKLGARRQLAWLAEWIRDPRGVRANAVMPKLLPPGDAGIRDLADMLAFFNEGAAMVGGPNASDTRASDGAAGDAWAAGEGLGGGGFEASAVRGAERFEALGCIGCHDLGGRAADLVSGSASVSASDLDPASPVEPLSVWFAPRVSLRSVAEKWRRVALVEFLRNPEEHHPGIGMPDFGLDDGEARDLAALLLEGAAVTPRPNLSAANAARGARRIAELGCLGCHDADIEDSGQRPPLAGLASGLRRGCLGEGEGRGLAPDFEWSAGDREALRRLLHSDLQAPWRDTARDYASRSFERLRCAACHDRDGRIAEWTRRMPAPAVDDWGAPIPSPDSAVGSAAGRSLPQPRPELSWVCGGLRPEWMAALFRGEHSPARPWLRARMPRFAVDAERLAAGLAAQHGRLSRSAPLVSPDPSLAEAGIVLMAQSRGLGCVQCHDRGRAKAAGIFDAQGPDLAQIPARLRRDYFDFLLTDPSRALGSPKMPAFVEDGRTAMTDVFGGDAARQFDALWHRLLELHRAASLATQEKGSR